MNVKNISWAIMLVLFVLPALEGQGNGDLKRLKYNNDNLVVDLGVGLWGNPMPMDYDHDGDWDLVVSCADTPYRGTYFFENTSGTSIWPVFKKPVRIGIAYPNTQVSFIDGEPHVLKPGVEFVDFTGNQYDRPRDLSY